MSKLFLSALLGLPLVLVPAVDLEGQSTSPSTPRQTSFCASGLAGGGPECAPERRLLIDVRRHGTGAAQELEGAEAALYTRADGEIHAARVDRVARSHHRLRSLSRAA